MNIISNKELNKIFLFVFIIVINFTDFTIAQYDSSSSLTANLSGGYAHSLYNKGSFQFGEYSRAGISGFLRVIWQSEHLLGIGIETGYVPLASLKQDNFTNEFGTSNIRANIDAFPILADFLFNFGDIFFNTSVGYYFISSRINAFQAKSFSNTFDFGFSFSIGYKYMMNRKFGIGIEAQSHNLVDTPQLAFSLQLMIIYNIAEL